MARVQQFQLQLEIEQEERYNDACNFSEILVKHKKEAKETKGALLRKLDSTNEMFNVLKKESLRMHDALANRERQIKSLTELSEDMAEDHQGEVTYLEKQLIAANSDKSFLKEQQMQSLKLEEQQHRQVLQLQEQMAKLVMQNKKLQQQASWAQALQQLRQPKVEGVSCNSHSAQGRAASSSSSSSCVPTKAPGALSLLPHVVLRPGQRSPLLQQQQQQQQLQESVAVCANIAHGGNSSSSSGVSTDLNSRQLSHLSDAAVSDGSDTAADLSDDGDNAVCITSSTFGSDSDSVLSAGSLPADSMGSNAAITLSTASSSSAGTSQQGVTFEGNSPAWQRFCMAWEETWFGA